MKVYSYPFLCPNSELIWLFVAWICVNCKTIKKLHVYIQYNLLHLIFFLISVVCFTSHDPLMILTPDHQIHVKEGQSLEVNCSVKDSAHTEKWQMPEWKAQGKVIGTVHQNRMSYNTVTLFFQRIHKSDAGIYKCIYNASNNVITKNLVIIVDARCKLLGYP